MYKFCGKAQFQKSFRQFEIRWNYCILRSAFRRFTQITQGNPRQGSLGRSLQTFLACKFPRARPRLTWLKLILNDNSICKFETLATNKNDWNDLIRGMMFSRTTNVSSDHDDDDDDDVDESERCKPCQGSTFLLW